MRASKAMSFSAPAPLPVSPWRISLRMPAAFNLKRLFTRKPPTLYQRCLAVHIAHTSRTSSLR